MVFHNYKCIFLHIPKTAGRSVTNALGGQGDIEELFWHETLNDHKKIISEDIYSSYFKFTFVRNPWDRVLSAYFWYKGGGVQNKADKYIGKSLPWRFTKFIKNYDNFIKDHDNELSPHFLPQIKIINDVNELDFLGRFERLEEDFSIICKKLNLQDYKLPHSNKSRHKPYWNYYNSKTIDIVADIFKDDIENFSYDFR
tara:strand:+ start:607 stop:1200 length:594 start_codon:yes stop_codon:yes gene_type:complete